MFTGKRPQTPPIGFREIFSVVRFSAFATLAGTKRTWRDVRLESSFRSKADLARAPF